MQKKTIDEWVEDFTDYRTVYGLSLTLIKNIKIFVNWCHKRYPDEVYLEQHMIDEWTARRTTEKETTHTSRVIDINLFIRHINDRGGTFKLAEHGVPEPTPEHRLITDEEFANVLRAADEIIYEARGGIHKKNVMTKALEMPVLLRLLFSSGMRIPEARLLDRKDVDLENGIIYIRKGKGYDERMIALDWGMNELMKEYDKKMEEFMPGRIPFFPHHDGGYRTNSNMYSIWRKLCDKYNTNTKGTKSEHGLVIYSLRHRYITDNIERLPKNGYAKDLRLLAISRSAGHANIDVTIKFYFHLSNRAADIMEEKMEDVFESIID